MEDDEQQYVVLINDEDQHCLWPATTAVPDGWKQTGPTGTKDECEAYVEENWTDMTPKSERA
ncbi:MAG: MbtH family protein [Paracoccaceae bacterium]